jgi:hypothetical protein
MADKRRAEAIGRGEGWDDVTGQDDVMPTRPGGPMSLRARMVARGVRL